MNTVEIKKKNKNKTKKFEMINKYEKRKFQNYVRIQSTKKKKL